MMRRLAAITLVCAGLAGCGGVDAKKFDAVYQTSQALHQEMQTGAGQARPQSRDLLKQFDTGIEALRGKTIGKSENDALQAYVEAADAYRAFLRFRSLTVLADDPRRIVVKGPDLEAANRYKLPIDSSGGSRFVNSAQAITIILQAAEQHLNDGDRLIKGK